MKKAYILYSSTYLDDYPNVVRVFLDYKKISNLIKEIKEFEKKYDDIMDCIHQSLPFNTYDLENSFILDDFYIEDEPFICLEDLSFKTNEELIADIKDNLSEDYQDREEIFNLFIKKYDVNKILNYLRDIIQSHPINSFIKDEFNSHGIVMYGVPSFFVEKVFLIE